MTDYEREVRQQALVHLEQMESHFRRLVALIRVLLNEPRGELKADDVDDLK